MKSLIKYFIGIAMLIFSGVNNFIAAQTETIQYAICENCEENNPTMGNPVNYTINQISSDFGMRVAGGGTSFHRGIDYVPPANAAVLAVRGGTITSIVGTGLKSITIQHDDGTYYAYLHIFDANIPITQPATNFIRSGAFVLHRIQSTGRFAILNLADGRGYCHHVDDVGKSIIFNGRQFRLVRDVLQGHAIAPVGTSLGYSYHLHISEIEEGVTRPNNQVDYWNSQTHCVDPWTSIISTPTTLVPRLRTRKPINYSGNTSDHNRGADNWGEIELVYPDKSKGKRDNPLGRNVLQVEVAMQNATRGGRDDRYTNVVMDENLIQVQLKKEHESNWNEIEGLNYQSHIRINPEGTETIYPSRINGNYGSLDSTGTGIVPFAYRTIRDNIVAESGTFAGGFNPWDYYIFPDFYPRIIKGHSPNVTAKVKLADSPSNAKYTDGKYKIRSRVENIYGNEFLSGELDFTLDNFLPFITRFQFKVGNTSPNAVFYDLDREQKEGEDNVKDDGIIANKRDYNPVNPGNRYYIELHSSEPLSNLTFQIKKNDAFLNNYNYPLTPDVTKTKWTSSVDISLFLDGDDFIDFIVTGKDMSNNGIINIGEIRKQEIIKPDGKKETLYNEPGTSIIIPTRKNNKRTKEAWNNYPSATGSDIFRVKMSGCLRSSSQEICDAIKLMEASKARYGCSSVRLKLENYVPTANVTWTDENGDEISYNPFIIVTSVGRYCYKILGEFGDDCCSKEGCIFVEESDFEDNGIEITPTIEPGCGDSNSEKGYVSLEVIPQGTYSYSWSHQSNGGNWARVAPGSHSVTVTSSTGCKRTLEYTVENANDALKIFEDVVPSDCGQNNGEIHLTNTLYGEDLISGFSLSWSNGSTQTSLYNLAPGEYCVTLRYGFPLCPITKCITVPEKKLELAASITPNTNCANGNHNGAISLDILNGTPPYTIDWADNSSELERINLKTGPYSVTVTDANGCRSSNIYNVPGTLPMSLTGTVSQDCGTKLYKIRLTNFPTNLVYFVILYKMENGVKELINYYAAYNGYEITDLTHGEYIIESSDLNCSFTHLNFSLPEPFKYLDMEVQENMGCFAGREDGEVTVYFEGGLRPLTVSLGNQSQTVQGNSVTFGNLNGGFHMINFVNPSGCTNWLPTYIPYPIINIEGTVVNVNGNNETGSITLNITGGSGNYSYQWLKNNQAFSAAKDLFNIGHGTYKVILTDGITGCIIEKTFVVNSLNCYDINKIKLIPYITPGDYCPQGDNNRNFASCTEGCNKNIRATISGLPYLSNSYEGQVFPIEIKLQHSNGYNQTKYLLNYPSFVDFTGLPVSFEPYSMTLTNPCGETIVEYFYSCLECADIQIGSDASTYFINDYQDFYFEIKNGCKKGGIISPSRIEISNAVQRPKSKVRLYSQQEYTITWPDSRQSKLIQLWSQGKQAHYVSVGGSGIGGKYNLKESDFNGEIKTIKIERKDGCTREFKFRIGNKTDQVVLFQWQHLEFLVGNGTCENCNLAENPSIVNPYAEALGQCYPKNIKLMNYVPTNVGNECEGGKLTRHISTATGVLLDQEEIVPSSALIAYAGWVYRTIEENEDLYPSNHEFFTAVNVDGGGCVFDKNYMFPYSNVSKHLYVNWFRLRYWNRQNTVSKPGCGEILNLEKKGNRIIIEIDPGQFGDRLIIKLNGVTIQNHKLDDNFYKKKFEFNTESYESGVFTFELTNIGNCQVSIKTLDSSFCLTDFTILPEDFNQDDEELTINLYSPVEEKRYFLILNPKDLDDVIHAVEYTLKVGSNSIVLSPNPLKNLPSGDYIFEFLAKDDCPAIEKRYTIQNFTGEDDSKNIDCKDVVLDIGYDSLKHNFHLFLGKEQLDSVLSYKIKYDTIFGYIKEFTRHHIVWDSIKFVRYDSTRTVYYFGTDSTRFFITSIDSTGSVFTQWFENIRFLSCSPANKKGIWHIVGYHITENKYYLYKFDKKFLTLHPTVIPNPDRGQTYSKFWSFGPAEYVSTIRSGQYTTMKFVSNAVPPMDVVLPHPFVVKTVVKWQNNQWLVTGDLNGTMVIGGDTIVTEEWTKSIFIWYDWTGTVIKYKVIESEDDRIITHVATDGFEKILFTGMTIDTIFNETLDSFTIETCIFGDTITIDGIPTLFKGHQPDLTSSVEAVLQEDQTFVRFYPNPFKSGINLRIDSPVLDKISLHVTSVLGTVVLTKDLNISEGRNEIYLQEFESLPGGLYTVWIKKSTGEKAFKVIKIE